MPRILSRNLFLYRRRRSLTSSTYAKSNGSLKDESILPGAASGNSTSSSMSTLLSSCKSKQRFPFGLSAVVDDNDTWGQFVDPSEVEEDFVRRSKILSRRSSDM